MRKTAQILFAGILLIAAAPHANATDRRDDFDERQYTFKLWDLCQAQEKLLWFEKGKRDPKSYLRDRINASSVDKGCGKKAATAERIGPSLTSPSNLVRRSLGDCEQQGGEGVNQRNEFRFRDRNDWHDANTAHWYTLRFKLSGAEDDKIPECGSNRWVTAQWKYVALGANDSPFLAQRFDNGILHVTVEDGYCRCMIAKGPGDPNKAIATGSKLREVAPIECKLNKEGASAATCTPANLKLYAYSQQALEQLPDPKRNWVTMTYKIKAGGAEESIFEVYANGHFIVRAEHALEEKVAFPNKVKFKFGHYRDKAKNSADMLIDRVCVSPDVRRCDKTVKPVEE